MRRRRNDYRHPLNQRVAKLESDVRHLGETIESLDQFMRHNLEALSRKLDHVSEKGRITWPVIITAIGTLASVAAIAGVMHTQSLRPLFDRMEDLESAVSRHMELPGHAEARMSRAALQVDVDQLSRRVDSMDKSLRREMQLLSELAHQRIETIDRQWREESQNLQGRIEFLDQHAHELSELRDTQLSERMQKLEK